jgi:hypothetical protein
MVEIDRYAEVDITSLLLPGQWRELSMKWEYGAYKCIF